MDEGMVVNPPCSHTIFIVSPVYLRFICGLYSVRIRDEVRYNPFIKPIVAYLEKPFFQIGYYW